MKKLIPLLLAATLMTGCDAGFQEYLKEGTRTAAELEAFHASYPAISKKNSVSIPRPPAAVTASLAQLAKTCLNKRVDASLRRHATFNNAGMNARFVSNYTAKITTQGGARRLVVFREDISPATLHVSGATKGVNAIFSARILPTSNGRTQLEIVSYRGFPELTSAVQTWANGKGTTCPDLPA